MSLGGRAPQHLLEGGATWAPVTVAKEPWPHLHREIRPGEGDGLGGGQAAVLSLEGT